MSSPISNHDKGKARASEVDERTPLLARDDAAAEGQSSSTSSPPQGGAQSWNRPILNIALLSLTGCFIAAAIFFVASGYRYASWVAHIDTDRLVKEGMVLKGPSNVEVVEVTSQKLVIRFEGAVGIDADWVLGIQDQDDGLLGDARAWFGRWLIKRVDQISVTVSEVGVYTPYSRSQHRIPDAPIVSVTVPLITIPLTTRRSELADGDDSWLTQISVHVTFTPTSDTDLLSEFAGEAWDLGRLLVRVEVPWVRVVGGTWKRWWKPSSLIEVRKEGIERIVRYDIPTGGSAPGDDPVSSLVTLRSYSLHTEGSTLGLSADLDVRNPLPDTVHGTLHRTFPFVISLLGTNQTATYPPNNTAPIELPPAPIAEVHTGPISFTHPNVSLSLAGTILPLKHESLPLISSFLSNYLNAISSPIQITAPAPFSISIRTNFPAPKEKPQVIKKINLQNMRVYPDPEAGEDLLAAGTIVATIQLPEGTENVKVDVGRILPDILVFDGPPPRNLMAISALSNTGAHASTYPANKTVPEPFPAPPLPSPLPELAFARIRPRAWLNSTNLVAPDPSDPSRNVTIVTAFMKDVPLDILPGRDAVFQRFLEKLIFKGSAVAGIRGDAAVGVAIEGLALTNGTDMELRGLPVEGVFTLRRGGHLKA